MKFFSRSLGIAVLLCLAALRSHAQTPGPQLPNTVPICATEGCTVTAISSPTAVLQFGAGATWNTITAPTLPMLADCNAACPQVGGDPASGVPKSLVAQEQATAYTVTLSDGTVVQVSALTSSACALPATFVANPTIPATPPGCPLPVGSVAIAPDGATVNLVSVASPVFLIYCQGSGPAAVCAAPVMFLHTPMAVGQGAQLGGPPGGSGAGTLYAIPGLREFTLNVNGGAATTFAAASQ